MKIKNLNLYLKITHGVGKNRYTDYEVRLRTNLPVFKHKVFSKLIY